MIHFFRYMLLLMLVGIMPMQKIHGTDNGWVFINYLGVSESFNSYFFLNVDGENNIKQVSADWDGRSLTDSLYYAIKVEKWKTNRGIGLEWVHHKVYLNSVDNRVPRFSLSDGYNLLFLNRVSPIKRFGERAYLRLGAGLVFGHPDVIIDDRERFYMDGGIGGSYLCGVAAQVSVDKWVKTFERHFMTVETKFTAAYARPPISTNKEEYGVVPNYAIHVVLGVGNKPATPKTLKDAAITFGIPPLYMTGTGYLIGKIEDLIE